MEKMTPLKLGHLTESQLCKVTKIFLNENNGWNRPRNETTIVSQHPYIFCHYALCLLVVCNRKVEAVGWVVLGVECMLMCARRVSYVVGNCSVVATEHGKHDVSCTQKL